MNNPQSLIQWHQVILYMRTEHKVICICII